jgi:hypothetical protein
MEMIQFNGTSTTRMPKNTAVTKYYSPLMHQHSENLQSHDQLHLSTSTKPSESSQSSLKFEGVQRFRRPRKTNFKKTRTRRLKRENIIRTIRNSRARIQKRLLANTTNKLAESRNAKQRRDVPSLSIKPPQDPMSTSFLMLSPTSAKEATTPLTASSENDVEYPFATKIQSSGGNKAFAMLGLSVPPGSMTNTAFNPEKSAVEENLGIDKAMNLIGDLPEGKRKDLSKVLGHMDIPPKDAPTEKKVLVRGADGRWGVIPKKLAGQPSDAELAEMLGAKLGLSTPTHRALTTNTDGEIDLHGGAFDYGASGFLSSDQRSTTFNFPPSTITTDKVSTGRRRSISAPADPSLVRDSDSDFRISRIPTDAYQQTLREVMASGSKPLDPSASTKLEIPKDITDLVSSTADADQLTSQLNAMKDNGHHQHLSSLFRSEAPESPPKGPNRTLLSRLNPLPKSLTGALSQLRKGSRNSSQSDLKDVPAPPTHTSSFPLPNTSVPSSTDIPSIYTRPRSATYPGVESLQEPRSSSEDADKRLTVVDFMRGTIRKDPRKLLGEDNIPVRQNEQGHWSYSGENIFKDVMPANQQETKALAGGSGALAKKKNLEGLDGSDNLNTGNNATDKDGHTADEMSWGAPKSTVNMREPAQVTSTQKKHKAIEIAYNPDSDT